MTVLETLQQRFPTCKIEEHKVGDEGAVAILANGMTIRHEPGKDRSLHLDVEDKNRKLSARAADALAQFAAQIDFLVSTRPPDVAPPTK